MTSKRYPLRSGCGNPCSTSMGETDAQQEPQTEMEVQSFQVSGEGGPEPGNTVDNFTTDSMDKQQHFQEVGQVDPSQVVSTVANSQDAAISGSSQALEHGGTDTTATQVIQEATRVIQEGNPLVVADNVEATPTQEKGVGKTKGKEKHVVLGAVLETEVLQRVIDSFRMPFTTQPPLVPLCRLTPHESVRTIRENISTLGVHFKHNGYVRELGTLMVSCTTFDDPEQGVTDDDYLRWGPLWCQVNTDFEKELELNPEWHFLSKKKFIVWDGNHRATAWMKTIREVFPKVKDRHIRVACTFLRVSPPQEGELLLALHNINRLTRVHVPHSLAHDIFMIQKFGMADKETLLRSVSFEIRKWIETEMRRDRGGVSTTWYNVPMTVLAQLVLKDEFIKLINDKTKGLDREKLTPEEFFFEEDQAIKDAEVSLVNKGYKLATIANPANGQGFFNALFTVDFNAKNNIVTMDKLQMIAASTVSPTRKGEILRILSSSKHEREALAIPNDSQGFRKFMAKETYWFHMFEVGKRLISTLSISSGEPIPSTFTSWFRLCRSCHFVHGFFDLQSKMKNAASTEDQLEVIPSAKRVVYRWLLSLQREGNIPELPLETDAWRTVDSRETMYPLKWGEMGLSDWELSAMPWWLEYPVGTYPPSERQLYAKEQELKVRRERRGSTASGTQQEVGSTSKAKRVRGSRSELRTKKRLDVHFVQTDGADDMPLETPEPWSVTHSDANLDPDNGDMQSTVVVCCLFEDLARLVGKKKCVSRQRLDSFCSTHTVTLFWASLPTSCYVEQVGDTETVPQWNVLDSTQLASAFSLAHTYLVPRGCFVCLSVPEQVFQLEATASCYGFTVYRMWSVLTQVGFMHTDETLDKINTLSLVIFQHTNEGLPTLHRKAGHKVNKNAFSLHSNWFMDNNSGTLTMKDGKAVRGGAERSPEFNKFVTRTFTRKGEGIVDVFAGVGGLARIARQSGRHCCCISSDSIVFKEHLECMNNSQ